ncbi:unnamed protein product, partial [Polarella glacialis]
AFPTGVAAGNPPSPPKAFGGLSVGAVRPATFVSSPSSAPCQARHVQASLSPPPLPQGLAGSSQVFLQRPGPGPL